MTAITTHYVGPTNTRGARIVAESCGLRKVVPYDHSSSDPHAKAALALILTAGWGGTWIEGGTRKGSAYVCMRATGSARIKCDSGRTIKAPVRITSR